MRIKQRWSLKEGRPSLRCNQRVVHWTSTWMVDTRSFMILSRMSSQIKKRPFKGKLNSTRKEWASDTTSNTLPSLTCPRPLVNYHHKKSKTTWTRLLYPPHHPWKTVTLLRSDPPPNHHRCPQTSRPSEQLTLRHLGLTWMPTALWRGWTSRTSIFMELNLMIMLPNLAPILLFYLRCKCLINRAWLAQNLLRKIKKRMQFCCSTMHLPVFSLEASDYSPVKWNKLLSNIDLLLTFLRARL